MPAGAPLLTGALTGLGENIIDKMFGKKGGTIMEPTQMVPMLNLLTAKQKHDLNNAYQTGG